MAPSSTTARRRILPAPSFFNPKNAADFNYNPDIAGKVFPEADAYRKAHGVKSVGGSRGAPRVVVVGIDHQRDFCFPQGTLYVGGRSGTGAIDDSVRFAKFLYANADRISDMTMTFDTHVPLQIFFQTFWNNADGTPVAAYREITLDQIRKGEVVINPAICAALGKDYGWARRQGEFYCQQLEKAGKYKLYIWPFHCLLGTAGHALVGVIEEARMFLSFLRTFQPIPKIKGLRPWSERYSAFSEEVLLAHDGVTVIGEQDAALIRTLSDADVVVFAGQAASHCVASSIGDFLDVVKAADPALVSKVYVLRDCMSAVVVPGVVDYTPQAEAALKRFSDEGMHVVDSITPMEEWPDVDSRLSA
jgi:nicotinamidase-related amidase